MTIYIDTDFKCHVSNAEGRRAFDTPYFAEKCPEYIEGFRYVPMGEEWTRSDGAVFHGEMIAPWKNYNELVAIQSAVDRAQAQAQQTITEYEQALTEIEIALGVTSK